MNRRNFLGSLIAAVPAVALLRAVKQEPVVIEPGPRQGNALAAGTSYSSLGMDNPLATMEEITAEQFNDVARTVKNATRHANGFNGYVEFKNPGHAIFTKETA